MPCCIAKIRSSCDRNNQENALSCAAKNGHHECVDMLLKAGVDVDDYSPRGTTALIQAAEEGQMKCVQSLIQAGACVNYTDIQQRTPLAIAVINGHDQILDLLLEAGADVNFVGGSYYDHCWIPLVHAAAQGHDKCVNLLLKAGSDVNAGFPLHRAAGGYNIGCMALLLLAGADVNLVTEAGGTALLSATSNNHPECVDFLLSHGATTKLDEALAEAVQFNFGKCIRSLVKAGANPNLYQNAATPLIRASCSGDAETVAVLIKAGADINAVNAKYPFGQSSDFYLDDSDKCSIETDDDNDDDDDDDIKVYQGEKDRDDNDDEDGDDIDYEIREKLQNCKYYDDHEEDEDDNLHRVTGYHTRAKAIFHAVANGHHECLDLLLKAGADVNDRNPRDGNTPLIRAAHFRSDECEEIVKYNEKAEFIHHEVNLEYQSIVTGSQPKHTSIFDMNKKEEYNYDHLPWKKTSEEDFSKCVVLLINAGADVNAINPNGATALHVALDSHVSDQVECVRALLAAGADVNKKNKSGDTPLTLASGRGHDKSLNLLLQAGVTENEVTPSLICAVEKGKSKCIDLLLEAGANVNARSTTGETPLLLAANKEYNISIDSLQTLINSGAGVNAIDTAQNTALHFAASFAHLKAVKVLLLAGAHVNRTDKGGETALQKCLNYVDEMFLDKGRVSEAAMVLFASGDSFDPSKVRQMKYGISSTLKEMMAPQLSLKDMCRHRIRNHLMYINSHLNLLVRVSKLGLPHSLASYVLFHEDKVGAE